MDEERDIENALHAYGERIRFKQRLAKIHAATDMSAMRQAADSYQSSLESSGQVRGLWKTYRTTLAVAASAAIITTFGSIFLYRSYQQSHKQEQQYSQLSKEIQAVKSSQRKLWSDLNGRGRALSLNPGQVAGTGFLITGDGYFVTNNHIVHEADSVYVQSNKGEVYKARVVYTDQSHDLAFLQLCDDSAFRPMPTVPYSFDARSSDLGERVYTLGYPREEIVYGEGYLSSGTGYRGDSTAYQVAIGVNPGNSGGPLLNEKGAIIGIISGKQTTSEGVSFAVKTNYLLESLNNIPADSLKGQPIRLNRKNALANLPRKQQIKRMQDYVYQVKVFKHKE
ncbi:MULTISPECIES: serine protease [unclassified Spirosoma]|uniref:S1C family serine protease n=1 Tax=unclassified Spirosoma TaxID=2621999 RepID=UPI000964BBA9|nr:MULTISPECIES: serine protease [unclassified Spirosoma]MBN8826226.1 trypsin-like peptidase domain-containing protein [Spirosoma sp.]OJW76881.1 MAG: serine protease [Spirosoma sp. 48-14]